MDALAILTEVALLFHGLSFLLVVIIAIPMLLVVGIVWYITKL